MGPLPQMLIALDEYRLHQHFNRMICRGVPGFWAFEPRV